MAENDKYQEQLTGLHNVCNMVFTAVMQAGCMLAFVAGQLLITLGQVLVLASGQKTWEDLQEGVTDKKKNKR